MSFLSFFTLRSYLAMTVIMSFITALASWKLFEFIRSYNINDERLLAFGVLLLPSLNFWCSGVSKDTIAFLAIVFLVINAFTILSKDKKVRFGNVLMILISSWVLLNVRSFIFIAFMIPFSFALLSRAVHFFGGGRLVLTIIRSLALVGGMVFVGGTLLTQSESDFIASNALVQEAAVIQQDFNQNETYGDKKYDLGTTDFSPVGLIRAAPLVIITGLFRPFLWEALNPTLIMNGLESLIFLYFTFLFFRRKVFSKIRKVSNHEFLVFCLIFTLFIAYMTGLTSILYGVLVRLRAPLLPFLFVLLTVKWDTIQSPDPMSNQKQKKTA